MARANVDLSKLQPVYFKPGFDQLYSHEVVEGFYDPEEHIFYTVENEYSWDEDDVLEFCKRTVR